jgi:uncharacterized protein (TIGR03000 family)
MSANSSPSNQGQTTPIGINGFIQLNNGIQTIQPNQFPFAQTLPLGTATQGTFLPVLGSMTLNTNPSQTNANQGVSTVVPLNNQPVAFPFGTFPFGFWGGAGAYVNNLDLGNNSLQYNQNFYSLPTRGGNMISPSDLAPAVVTVRAPYSAEVYVQDQKLEQTGEEHKFVSPILSGNRTYNYDVRATWMEDGEKVSATQRVNVRAGEQKSVLFIGGSSSDSQKEEKPSRPQSSIENQGTSANTARIEIQVPSDAQVLIEGQKMTSTGESRRFVTPPLTPGRVYSYDIRVILKENGREVTTDRHITVRAGDQQKLDFSTKQDEKPSPEKE